MSEQLPPSCKLVLKVLEYEGPCSRQELLEETRLPKTTLEWALSKLEESERVAKDADAEDLRQVAYNIRG